MDHPDFTVCSFMEKSIGVKRIDQSETLLNGLYISGIMKYRKTCLKLKTKVLKVHGSLMKVESIAECSTRDPSILNLCIHKNCMLYFPCLPQKQ